MEGFVGFRPPQFSEDMAWLPTWLQQQNVEPFDEVIKRGETPFEQRIKELQFLGKKIDKEENASLSARPEDFYTSFHLLLSGDESSPHSCAPSNDDVVHLRLHLSPDGNSESITGPLVYASQLQEHASNHAVLKQELQTSAVLEEKNNPFGSGQNACLISRSPSMRLDNQNVLMHHKDNTKCSEVDDVCEVIELSIAASEAVLIHEMMKPFPVSNVLQAAFELKKARLDVCEESLHTGNASEFDYLSDLEDLTMTDAYEDVGLLVADPADLCSPEFSVSQVKDTLASENHGCDGHLDYESTSKSPEFAKQKVEHVLDTDTRLRDNLASQGFYGHRQKKVSSNPSLCLDSIDVDCERGPIVNCSVQENLRVLTLFEAVNDGKGKENFFEAPEKSSLARTSDEAEKYKKISDICPGRYQSRWFGGWACKQEVKSSVLVEHKNMKLIPQTFIGETSFFSESADIAPDENSLVQKQDRGTIFASQSSIVSVGICNKPNHETLLSEDVERVLSLSCSDPLCSVVPCSISTENVSATPLNHEGNILTRRYSTSTTKCATDHLQRTTISQDKLIIAEESTVLVSHSEMPQAALYKKLSSLRPYSVLVSSPDTILVKGSTYNKPLLMESITGVSMMQIPVPHLAKYNEISENVAESPILKRKSRPLILKCGSRHCSEVVRCFRRGFGNKQKSVVQNSAIKLLLSKDPDPKKVHFTCDTKFSAQAQREKRVRFLDAEINNPPKKKHQKQPVALESRYTANAGKRPEHTNTHTCRTQEFKWCQTNFFETNHIRLVFQNMEFLLTGFSSRKEREFEGLIRRYGGIVLFDIPSPNFQGKRSRRLNPHMLPVVICLKRLPTVKFLYGCAVKAFVLKVDWLIDSIIAGSVLPPEQYSILPKKSAASYTRTGDPMSYNFHRPIFGNAGIMLYGRGEFCIGMAKVIKHGGGQVFKKLQSLIESLDANKISKGAIVAENERRASRHLKQCAIEHKIPVLSISWIVKSLQMGKLLPCIQNRKSSPLPPIKLADFPARFELSEEI